MDDLIFIQRSRLGRSVFALGADSLEITTLLLGRKTVVEIPLRTIASDYALEARRSGVLIAVPLVLAAGCFGLVYLIFSQDTVSELLAIYPAMMAPMFGWQAFKGVRRLESFVLTNHRKEPLFAIIRERAQAEECDAFVRALLDRIENPEIGHLPAEPDRAAAPPASAVRLSPNESELEPREEHRYIVAIAAGAFSAGFPVVTYYGVRELVPFNVVVVVVASACGIFFGVLSFLVRERRKNWSIVGLVLSLMSLLFYWR